VIHGIVDGDYVLLDMISMLYTIAYVEHSEHIIGCNSQWIAIVTVNVSTLTALLEKVDRFRKKALNSRINYKWAGLYWHGAAIFWQGRTKWRASQSAAVGANL